MLKFELLGVSPSVAMKNRSHLSTVLVVDLKHDAMLILLNTAEKYSIGLADIDRDRPPRISINS